jgi:pimeloyl-ACP methyl ester carboxylesterase
MTTSGFVEVDGGQLYYVLDGSGPAVTFVHAGIADHTMWDAQIAALSPHFTVLRYDTRGFGRSTTQDVPFTNRGDLLALLDQLHIEQTALVGCSRGGQIALDTAVSHAERVTKLVWVCSGVGGFELPDESFDPREIALFTEMEAAEQSKDFERIATLDVRVWVDGPLQPAGRADAAVRAQVYAMALNNYRSHATYGQPQPLDPPAATHLAELSLPILAIVGDLDFSSVSASADYLVANAPNARRITMHGTAHVPSMERPEEFNRIVQEFLHV